MKYINAAALTVGVLTVCLFDVIIKVKKIIRKENMDYG